jgi:transcriptional regulator GlxA family with amidase domain
MLVAIYLFDGVTALDAVGPYEVLSRAPDAEVLFVGNEKGGVRTGNGFLGLSVDASLAQVDAPDVLIIPGGNSSSVAVAARDEGLLSWIRRNDLVSRWTCSVCTGSILLGAAGLLRGRSVATNWRAREFLPRFGAVYSEQRVTFDGKYVTSAGVTAGLDMALRLSEHLSGRAVAEAIELSIEYDPQPPYGTGRWQEATPERVALVEGHLRN